MCIQSKCLSLLCIYFISRQIILILFKLMLSKSRENSNTLFIHSSHRIPENSAIFFIETNNNLKQLKSTTQCAVESAAIANPDKPIFIAVEKDKSGIKQLPTHLTEIYSNLNLFNVSIQHLVKGTLAEPFWNNNIGLKSRNRLNNVSNFLRLILLWRIGGYYLDNDMISRRALPDINFIVQAQQLGDLNTALLGFQKRHDFIESVLRSMIREFRGSKWGSNGPILFTKVADKYCKFESNWVCPDFKVLNEKTAYPIRVDDWSLFYNSTHFIMKELTKDSLAVHYWNHMRIVDGDKYRISEEQPLFQLLKDSCPVTFENDLQHRLGQIY